MECHFLKTPLSRNYQFLSRRWTYVRSEVDDVYSIPRPRCPLVAPDTSSICQLQAPPRWGTSCSFTSQSRRENIGPQFRTPSDLWICDHAGAQVTRDAGVAGSGCNKMIATNDAFIVGRELITTNDTLLATGWSRRTTHCWRWVFQLIRYLGLNETNSNKSCSVGRALWYFEYLHKPLGSIELFKRTTLLFHYVLQI